jgi:hypothetical protein
MGPSGLVLALHHLALRAGPIGFEVSRLDSLGVFLVDELAVELGPQAGSVVVLSFHRLWALGAPSGCDFTLPKLSLQSCANRTRYTLDGLHPARAAEVVMRLEYGGSLDDGELDTAASTRLGLRLTELECGHTVLAAVLGSLVRWDWTPAGDDDYGICGFEHRCAVFKEYEFGHPSLRLQFADDLCAAAGYELVGSGCACGGGCPVGTRACGFVLRAPLFDVAANEGKFSAAATHIQAWVRGRLAREQASNEAALWPLL